MLTCISPVSPTKTFGWGHSLQKGDLSIFLCDGDSPGYPSYIKYSLYLDRGDGSRSLVGVSLRDPVCGCPGEYYPIGTLSRPGQPGVWYIVWTFQRSSTFALQSVEQSFVVSDLASTCSSTYRKYGWS
jgi:hypothetical protein